MNESLSQPRAELSYRQYQPGDERDILELFEKSFGRKLSIDYWRWRFAENPAGPAVIYLAWAGNVLAAHYAVSLVTLHVGGHDVTTALSGTTMTHPDYRGLGLFPVLARLTYQEMARREMALVWGFPNANSHRGFIQDLDWKDICEIPTMRVTISGRVMTDPSPGVSEITDIDSARFDRLWQAVSARESVLVKRDAQYLKWRFSANPSEKYRVVACMEGDSLRGYAIFKRYKDELQIVDLLVEQPDIAQQLAYGIGKIGREESAATISLWMPMASPVHRSLEKVGFQNDALVTYFGGLILGDLVPALIYSPFSWYYSMSDSDVY